VPFYYRNYLFWVAQVSLVFAKPGVNLDVAALVCLETILFMAMFAFEIEPRVHLSLLYNFFK